MYYYISGWWGAGTGVSNDTLYWEFLGYGADKRRRVWQQGDFNNLFQELMGDENMFMRV